MNQLMGLSRKFFGLWFAIAGTALVVVYSVKVFTIPPAFLYRAFMLAGALSLVIALLWQWKEKQVGESYSYIAALTLVISTSLAYFFCFYAMGKIFELQFQVYPDMMAKKAGSLSGFEKAWLFFAHSGGYNFFIAGGQLLAVLLLVFARTRTAGALLYFFIMSNITVIDFAYGVEAMRDMAVLLLCMSVYLILVDGQRVKAFLFSAQSNTPIVSRVKISPWYSGLAVMLLAAGVINDIVFFWRVAQ
jgi:hypothetical protein